jgi:uncharacterized protein (TIGR03435 family)
MLKVSLSVVLFVLLVAGQKDSSFEVAVMKRNEAFGPVGDMPRNFDASPGRFRMEDMPLRYILEWAYDLKDYEIAGPQWIIADERFDIVAKAAGPATDEEMRPMLQNLLIDRLQMKVHRETRNLPVYVLLPGKGPAKLTDAPETEKQGISPEGNFTAFHKFPISRLTFLLTRRMDRPVIDLTELKGVYDYSLDLNGLGFNGLPPADPTAGPSIFTAISDDLNLKLDARRHPVEVLVVDHAEKIPKPN